MGEMGWAKPFTQRINKSNIKVTQKKVNSRAGNMAIKIWEWYFYSKHSSGTTRLYFIRIREYGEHFTYMAGYKTNDGFYSGKCDTISSFDSHFTRYHIKCYNVMEAWNQLASVRTCRKQICLNFIPALWISFKVK